MQFQLAVNKLQHLNIFNGKLITKHCESGSLEEV